MPSQVSSPLTEPFSSGYTCLSQGDLLKSAWASCPDMKHSSLAAAYQGEYDNPREVKNDIEFVPIGCKFGQYCSAELSGNPYEMLMKSCLSLHWSTPPWNQPKLHKCTFHQHDSQSGQNRICISETSKVWVSLCLNGWWYWTCLPKKDGRVKRIHQFPAWPIQTLSLAEWEQTYMGIKEAKEKKNYKWVSKNLQLCVIQF